MADKLSELPLVLPRTAQELNRAVELISRKINEIIRTSRLYADEAHAASHESGGTDPINFFNLTDNPFVWENVDETAIALTPGVLAVVAGDYTEEMTDGVARGFSGNFGNFFHSSIYRMAIYESLTLNGQIDATAVPGDDTDLPPPFGTGELIEDSGTPVLLLGATATRVPYLNSDLLDYLHAADLLARSNHTGLQDWTTIDSATRPITLAGYGITDAASDAELAAHEADTSVHGISDTAQIPMKNLANTYLAGQIVQRTAVTNLGFRFSTAAGAATEIMVDGSYAMGVPGSARDTRFHRSAANTVQFDNNAGGAGHVLVGGDLTAGNFSSPVAEETALLVRVNRGGTISTQRVKLQADAFGAGKHGLYVS